MKIKECFILDKLSKEEQLLIKIYTEVYKRLGVDFMEIDCSNEKWFMEYEMSHKEQEEIAMSILNKVKLSKWRKNSLMSYYWLGCSPKFPRS